LHRFLGVQILVTSSKGTGGFGDAFEGDSRFWGVGGLNLGLRIAQVDGGGSRAVWCRRIGAQDRSRVEADRFSKNDGTFVHVDLTTVGCDFSNDFWPRAELIHHGVHRGHGEEKQGDPPRKPGIAHKPAARAKGFLARASGS
jgi:hypothetical protein